MINSITDCFNNYLYNINITDKYIDIINYKEIRNISENNIEIILNSKKLIINGNNLLVKKMDKYEVLITGNVEKVIINEE